MSDKFKKTALIGLISLILLQSLINLGVTINLLPTGTVQEQWRLNEISMGRADSKSATVKLERSATPEISIFSRS